MPFCRFAFSTGDEAATVFCMLLYASAERPKPVTGNTMPEMIKEGGSAMRKKSQSSPCCLQPSGLAGPEKWRIWSSLVCCSNLICQIVDLNSSFTVVAGPLPRCDLSSMYFEQRLPSLRSAQLVGLTSFTPTTCILIEHLWCNLNASHVLPPRPHLQQRRARSPVLTEVGLSEVFLLGSYC